MSNDKSVMMHDATPDVLPVIPTMDVVVFPHMVVPLLVLDEQIINGIEQSLEASKKILVLTTKEPAEANGPIGVQDLYRVGTVASIMRVMKVPEGGLKVLIQGLYRASVEEITSDEGVLTVRVQDLPFSGLDAESEIEQKLTTISSLIDTMSSTGSTLFSPDFQVILSQIKDPEKIADFILSHLNLSVTEAQELLEKPSIMGLLDGIYQKISREMEVSSIQEKIQAETRDSINNSQREYYLREQMRAIKKELGDDTDSEVDELRQKLDNLELAEEARKEVNRQMSRLEKLPADSMETGVIRNYLDWMVAMPWGKTTKDNLDITHVKQVLDDEHFGLSEIKERILDFLSVRSLKESCVTPILCFAGPPGVGKTSLGRSIANGLGRKFHRISLGGVSDESEIRGHRRTYVGAMPGRFVQAMRKAGSMNPVLMIDEIDKIGQDHRGDPSAALLEVLDPEQNVEFHDNYLGIPLDMSKTLFICTANDLSRIPAPLRDRMEIIQLSGYTAEEKVEIANRHLLPKAIENFGLSDQAPEISSEVLREVVTGYTREAGVRELERLIQKLCAKYARGIVQDKTQIQFTTDNMQEYLGVRRHQSLGSMHKNRVGVTNGLAWTPYGGEVLQVEAVLMPGKGNLILTGQLGDVMKESAQAAVTYAKANAKEFGLLKKRFTDFDLHIHLPAGAIPKDGPSAGITLLSSILSAYTGRPISAKYAMTGELNLQGEVLPIGGLKEKILAAKQEGIKNLIVPKQNEQDLYKLEDVTKDINIFFVEEVKEVLKHVLMPGAKKAKAKVEAVPVEAAEVAV